jgi:hypothetical protein
MSTEAVMPDFDEDQEFRALWRACSKTVLPLASRTWVNMVLACKSTPA